MILQFLVWAAWLLLGFAVLCWIADGPIGRAVLHWNERRHR